MTLSKIWVFAEATDGKVSSTTLEVLTKARELADTVEAVYVGGDADAVAGPLGAHGVTTVHSTGDLGGALPGAPVAAAIADAIGAAAPDAILFGTSYAARDVVGRLSVKLDRTVLTNGVDLALEGDALAVTEPVFGGSTNVVTTFTGAGPALVLIRPKSFAAEESGGARRDGRAARRSRRRCVGRRSSHRAPRRGARGSPARGRRDRRVRRPWTRRGREVPHDRGPGQAARRRRRAPRAPSSTPAGCPTRTRSARPARS